MQEVNSLCTYKRTVLSRILYCVHSTQYSHLIVIVVIVIITIIIIKNVLQSYVIYTLLTYLCLLRIRDPSTLDGIRQSHMEILRVYRGHDSLIRLVIQSQLHHHLITRHPSILRSFILHSKLTSSTNHFQFPPQAAGFSQDSFRGLEIGMNFCADRFKFSEPL